MCSLKFMIFNFSHKNSNSNNVGRSQFVNQLELVCWAAQVNGSAVHSWWLVRVCFVGRKFRGNRRGFDAITQCSLSSTVDAYLNRARVHDLFPIEFGLFPNSYVRKSSNFPTFVGLFIALTSRVWVLIYWCFGCWSNSTRFAELRVARASTRRRKSIVDRTEFWRNGSLFPVWLDCLPNLAGVLPNQRNSTLD